MSERLTKLTREIGSCFGPGGGSGAAILSGCIGGTDADMGLILAGSLFLAGVVKVT